MPTVHVVGPNGPRAIAFAEFHRLPGDKPHIDTTLQPSEIVTWIELPATGFAANYSYSKVRDRSILRICAGVGRSGARN